MASTALGGSSLEMEVKLASIFTVAAVLMSPALVFTSLSWAGGISGVAMVVYLAVACTVGAYSLFNRGLRSVAPASAATLGLTEPLVAAVLGVVVIGERLSSLSWLGAAIVLMALVVMIHLSRSALRAAESPTEARAGDQSRPTTRAGPGAAWEQLP